MYMAHNFGRADAGDPAAFVDAEKLKRAEAEIMVLQRQLESKETEAVMARASEREWRQRMHAYGLAVEQQRENTLDITSDLSRQYKAMQEQSLRRIDELEQRNRSLEEAVAGKQALLDALAADRAALIEERNRTVADLQVFRVCRPCWFRLRPLPSFSHHPSPSPLPTVCPRAA